jgi:hypothetical protein
MTSLARVTLCLAGLLVSGAAAADSPSAVVPKETEVHFALETPVSTATAKPGDVFRLRTTAPVVVDGVERIPAGTPATGQVVHAQKAGAFGKAGELILAVRRIDLAPTSVPMHKLEPLVGRDRSAGAMAVAVAVGPFAAFVRGGQIVVPAGTEVIAFVAADTPIAQDSPSSPQGETQQ